MDSIFRSFRCSFVQRISERWTSLDNLCVRHAIFFFKVAVGYDSHCNVLLCILLFYRVVSIICGLLL